MNNQTVQQIQELKKKKNAVIMAHYYVSDEVQEIADYIGDSYYLSDMATKIDADVIVLCGVSFMGESAKILNPDKMVLVPAQDADCPMAHMATKQAIEKVRAKYDDVAVVCYVNSTAELKALSDVCVTSANALKIVKAIPNKHIFFIPDQNLAHYIAQQLPDKEFIFNDGYCHIHHSLTMEDVQKALKEHPNAELLIHPECKPEVVKLAQYAGSTSGIIEYATKSEHDEFVVATEQGVMYELRRRNPDKKFYTAGNLICKDMKKITIDNILKVLQECDKEVVMEQELMEQAHQPMKRMLELSK